MNKNDLPAKRLAKPINVHNIFFKLERQRLIQENQQDMRRQKLISEIQGVKCETPPAVEQYYPYPPDLTGYEFLSLPDLPPRYQHVKMPPGWFVPGKDPKRKHVRVPGCELRDSSLTSCVLYE